MTAKPKSKPRKRAPKKKKAPAAAPVETFTEEELPPELPPVEASDAPLPDEDFSGPETMFSERVPAAVLPERLWPTRRRAIFIDVENTSRASRVTEALAAMQIDRADAMTDLVASGNWRVIGNETARLLAKRGAHLVHSAPATGVRDWSDLRIAVGAGVWLASARPGDRLDIVSDDRAFDAVGDVAATLGVEFNRHSFRGRGTAEVDDAPAPSSRSKSAGGAGRNRRGGRRTSSSTSRTSSPRSHAAAAPLEASAPSATNTQEQPIASPPPDGPPAAAPHGDLLRVVRELLEGAPGGVTLDTLANRLKQLGFQRPPNSPRLVTRLRAFKELSVSERGHIRMAGAPGEPVPEDPPLAEGAAANGAAGAAGEGQRRRRRGGRGRGRGGSRPPTTPTA